VPAINIGESNMNKPYVDGVSLEDIIEDGWSRGFPPSQTIEEAKMMGFDLPLEHLLAEWQRYDDAMVAVFMWDSTNDI
jgi:hypothetical protein